MARTYENATFSPTILRLAERAHKVLGDRVTKMVAGSEYEHYRQPSWETRRDIDPRSLDWVGFGGDPWVHSFPQVWRRLPKYWRYAGVVASYSWALRDARPKDKEAREAAAYVSDDVVHVAALPEGASFTDLSEADGQGRSIRGMAFRVGGGLLRATIGWLDEDQQFSAPYDVFPVRPTTLLIEDQLGDEFPGVLLS